MKISKGSGKDLRINEQIRDAEIRLIGPEGDQLGIISRIKAQQMADDNLMDLVLIAPQARPPVCRIMDYGKFKFEQAKKQKEARRKQKVIVLKEVQLSAAIEKHDLEVKARKADGFLKTGNKVKVSIRFRGREKAHTHIGFKVMEKFLEMLTQDYIQERKARLDGWQMLMILAPKET